MRIKRPISSAYEWGGGVGCKGGRESPPPPPSLLPFLSPSLFSEVKGARSENCVTDGPFTIALKRRSGYINQTGIIKVWHDSICLHNHKDNDRTYPSLEEYSTTTEWSPTLSRCLLWSKAQMVSVPFCHDDLLSVRVADIL